MGKSLHFPELNSRVLAMSHLHVQAIVLSEFNTDMFSFPTNPCKYHTLGIQIHWGASHVSIRMICLLVYCSRESLLEDVWEILQEN